MIAIISACGANLASVQFAIKRLNQFSILTTDANIIKAASHVILPGVGNAKQAMLQLQKLNLIEVIKQLTQPVLGICLGMQLFFEFSEEGNIECLGIMPGEVFSFPTNIGLSIPHVGWNQLQIDPSRSSLLANISDKSDVYFVHSYIGTDSAHTLAWTEYGIRFPAIVQNKNFYGVQFHPERSGQVGENILQNFLNIRSS